MLEPNDGKSPTKLIPGTFPPSSTLMAPRSFVAAPEGTPSRTARGSTFSNSGRPVILNVSGLKTLLRASTLLEKVQTDADPSACASVCDSCVTLYSQLLLPLFIKLIYLCNSPICKRSDSITQCFTKILHKQMTARP